MARLLELEELPIRVTARGVWLHGAEPLHPKVQRLFEKSVRIDAHGAYQLRIEFRTAPIEVEDTAFFVRRTELDVTDGRLMRVRLVLSDEREEMLDPTTLMQSAEHVLYCRV